MPSPEMPSQADEFSLRQVSRVKCFDGEQYVFEHDSDACSCKMKFAFFSPPKDKAPGAALLWLSGLTCTEQNFVTKAGAQRVASELGLALVCPDTSPRGEGVPNDLDGAYDLGLGAGFYLDATEQPWVGHYKMRRYILEELLPASVAKLSVDPGRVGISGHSMGGHGALTLGLTAPDQFRSISAFAPIANPVEAPCGKKAFDAYLGSDKELWRAYDATCLIADGARPNPMVDAILVDQGLDDEFLDEQLMPRRLETAGKNAGIGINLRFRDGYDHSYYFIASFITDHLRWHASRL